MVNVLAMIGFLAIIIYVIYSIWNYFDKINRENTLSKIRPTLTYMQNVGVKCPEYWDLVEVDKDSNYVCQDTFQLMKKYEHDDDVNCVDSALGAANGYHRMSFVGMPEGMNWVTMTEQQRMDFVAKANESGSGSVSRANWIRKCGSGPGANAVWSGLETYMQ